jgi:NlpC/P60 family
MTRVTAGSGGLGAITGSQIISEAEKLGKAATGYSETADGGTGPQYYDCSGLVQQTLEHLGAQNVPRTSEEQWSWVTHISQAQLQPGDLVFAQFPGDNASPGHVGIYVGGGQVYSAQDEALGIGNASLASWSGNIVGYGKVPDSTETGSAPGTSSSGTSNLPTSSVSISGISSLLKNVEPLIHGVAIILDRFFGLFARGQQWRIAFGIGALIILIIAFRTYTGGGFSFSTPIASVDA